jgi:hypothetical protein
VDEEDYFKRHLKRHKTGFKYFQNENFEMKVKGQSKKRMFVFKCFICNHLIENTFELKKMWVDISKLIIHIFGQEQNTLTRKNAIGSKKF